MYFRNVVFGIPFPYPTNTDTYCIHPIQHRPSHMVIIVIPTPCPYLTDHTLGRYEWTGSGVTIWELFVVQIS